MRRRLVVRAVRLRGVVPIREPLIDPRSEEADLLNRESLAFGRHQQVRVQPGDVMDERTSRAIVFNDSRPVQSSLEHGTASIDAKLAALEEDFKQREAAMKLKVDAAEAKAKEFERKNFQTVSEMKLQSNKDVNDALSSARASFAKEKEELLRKVEEERLQSRLEVQREKEAIRQRSDELIDEIALEFRREIETRSSR